MRAAASKSVLGAAVGASYWLFKSPELQQQWEQEEEKAVQALRVGSEDRQRAFSARLQKYGACILPGAVPLSCYSKLQNAKQDLTELLGGITFQGRPLLAPSGTINLDVAGAAVGSALAMPLLIPGSFLAGALVGQSSGYVLSMLRSMKQPSVQALLDTACSRTAWGRNHAGATCRNTGVCLSTLLCPFKYLKLALLFTWSWTRAFSHCS